MSNYVKIAGSVGDVLAAAGKMSSEGGAFVETAKTLAHRIRAAEDSGILGGTGESGDEYYNGFVKNYHQVAQGATKPANIAVTDLAVEAGTQFQTRGQQATNGFTAYLGVDGQNAISIEKAAQQQAAADAINAKNAAAAKDA
jgi:hypothetical protein